MKNFTSTLIPKGLEHPTFGFTIRCSHSLCGQDEDSEMLTLEIYLLVNDLSNEAAGA
jgi:hypothetical protein